MEFKDKLKQLRINKNMTQDDLADKLHITRQSISKWEQGLAEPNLDTIKAICTIFDVSIAELVDANLAIVTTKENKQLKTEYKLFVANLAFLIFGMLLSAVLIRMMPARIPMHWNAQGEITRYGSKWETLFFFVFFLLFFGFSLLMHFYYAKRKKEYVAAVILVQIMTLVASFLGLVFYSVFAFISIDDATVIIPAVTGIMLSLFIVLTIVASPIFNKQRNIFFGLRTQFTLSNNAAWQKVNTFQCISALVFVGIGYFINIVTFSDWNVYLLGLILLSLIPTMIYHRVLRKKMKNN